MFTARQASKGIGRRRQKAKFSQVVSVHEFVTQRLFWIWIWIWPSPSGVDVLLQVVVLFGDYSPRYATCLYPRFLSIPRVLPPAVSFSPSESLSAVSPRASEPAPASPHFCWPRLAPTRWLLLRLTTHTHHHPHHPPAHHASPSPANRVQSLLIHARPH